MFKVSVSKEGRIFRVRHFSTLKKAEKYEDEQYRYNPIAVMCDFKIEEIKTEAQCIISKMKRITKS